MKIRYSARSHTGFVRTQNQDNLLVNGIYIDRDYGDCTFSIDGYSEEPVVLAVCDGMGGEDGGEVASLYAVRALCDIETNLGFSAPEMTEGLIQNCVNRVNSEIQAKYAGTDKRAGTTLALVVISDYGIQCFNIGDTRVYKLGKTGLRKITKDHTFSADKVKCGIITEEQVGFDKDRHKLTKCIGIGVDHTVESYPLIKEKCRLIICSDGLTDMVADCQIEEIMQSGKYAEMVADELLKMALQNGGRDNISLIVADVSVRKTILLNTKKNKFRK